MSDHEGRRLRVIDGREGDGRSGEPPEAAVDRRRFLTLMGASLALAGAGGCTRQPPERIVPYVKQPEDTTPGQARYYATATLHGGYATGILARSLTGRPVKIEGNPDHPASLGAADSFAQASVLTLYDPDRAQVATRLGRITTWARVVTELGQRMAEQRAIAGAGPAAGAGIRLLTGAVTSPTLADEIRTLLAEYPGARWHRFEPAGLHHTAAGARLAFGAPLNARLDLTKADVIVGLESDLLAVGPGRLRYAREFASRRAPGADGSIEGAARPPDGALAGPMNRLYCVESSPTSTGTLADHRLALRPSEVGAFAAALAAELGVASAGARPGDARFRQWAPAIARDLRAHAGRSLVAVGEPAAPSVHALAAAMNEALGNAGATVSYSDPVEVDPVDHLASIRELAADMAAGRVSTLVILGSNPVYDAPAELDFAAAMTRVATCVHLSLYADETSAYCHYFVPAAHELEAWGDGRAFDGTATVVQPLIEPLHGGRTAVELVSALRGRAGVGGLVAGLDRVRATWQVHLAATGDFEDAWRRSLQDGVVAETAFPARVAAPGAGVAERAVADLLGAPRRDGYELALRADPTVDDGRFANNGWLQELPKPHTRLTWDNAAIVSPATAAELGVSEGDVVELALAGEGPSAPASASAARGGRTVRAPVFVLAGHPDGTVTAHLGYGRSAGGHVGAGVGFDAYRLRTSGAPWLALGLVVRKTGESYPLATTQQHFRVEGRKHVRAATLDAFRERPDLVREMGEEPAISLYPPWKYDGRQWGMSIDQGICTGCSACITACDAENNVPVVGKREVIAGREMHWLRVDRYLVEGGAAAGESEQVVNQPMMCVHCENAPCEYVCPVEATSHSAEGLNEMTYNRCVGTRYCQNNCPYKVRRFNFRQYADLETKELRLLRNPEVTVRHRGVMEKCTYCVQRIAAGRIDAEREGREVRDGEVVTACQAACPTGAIVFGNIRDPGARVAALKLDPRSYGVLAELNTHPRTTHMARIRNPNPELSHG